MSSINLSTRKLAQLSPTLVYLYHNSFRVLLSEISVFTEVSSTEKVIKCKQEILFGSSCGADHGSYVQTLQYNTETGLVNDSFFL